MAPLADAVVGGDLPGGVIHLTSAAAKLKLKPRGGAGIKREHAVVGVTPEGLHNAPAVDHRAKLVAFYEKHNPAKLDSIDATLAKYAGRESELFEALRAKYEAPAAVEEKVDAPDAPPATSAPAPATPALPVPPPA